MDDARGTHLELPRPDVYRQAADEALAELDEIQTDILGFEARLVSLMARARTLEALIAALHDLLGPSVEVMIPYSPATVADLGPSDVLQLPLPQRRSFRNRSLATDGAVVS